MLATVPNPVVYEKAVYTVQVHCAAEATEPCAGSVWLHLNADDIGPGPFQVAAGKTVKVRIRAGKAKPQPGEKTIKVSFSLEGQSFDRRLKGAPPAESGGGGGGAHVDYPITHVVKDRRGDGVGALDLRRAEAHVRNRRLIITWTCWRAFTPAQMSHDAGGFDANVYTRKPHTAGATRQHASVFYGTHGPVLFAGSEQGPNDWGGRFYRPNSRSVRMSIPLSRYGRHVRQLWIEPSAYATTNLHYDMTESTIHFRTGG